MLNIRKRRPNSTRRRASQSSCINFRLAYGASITESSAEITNRCFQMALTPSINQMAIAGLVAIPGMMTGQVLAGQDPSQAARYQIMILFCIAGSSLTSLFFAVSWIGRGLVFDKGRESISRGGIVDRKGGRTDILTFLLRAVKGFFARVFCGPAARGAGYTRVAEADVEAGADTADKARRAKTVTMKALSSITPRAGEPLCEISRLVAPSIFEARDLILYPSDVVALVGESGSGKTQLCLGISGLR